MPTRFASLAAAGALTLAVLGAVPAWADDAPVRGTDECTVAVNASPAVVAAVDALDGAQGLLSLIPATAPLADRTQATQAVTDADADLVAARAAAVLNVCVDPVVTTPDPTSEPTPTTEPTTTTPAPVDAVEARIARIRVLIDAIECGPNYNALTGAVDDALFFDTSAPRLSNEQSGALRDEYNGLLQAINFCYGTNTSPTTTVPVTVDPTADDGSVANTSGTQVTVVPEGSAQTGVA